MAAIAPECYSALSRFLCATYFQNCSLLSDSNGTFGNILHNNILIVICYYINLSNLQSLWVMRLVALIAYEQMPFALTYFGYMTLKYFFALFDKNSPLVRYVAETGVLFIFCLSVNCLSVCFFVFLFVFFGSFFFFSFVICYFMLYLSVLHATSIFLSNVVFVYFFYIYSNLDKIKPTVKHSTSGMDFRYSPPSVIPQTQLNMTIIIFV